MFGKCCNSLFTRLRKRRNLGRSYRHMLKCNIYRSWQGFSRHPVQLLPLGDDFERCKICSFIFHILQDVNIFLAKLFHVKHFLFSFFGWFLSNISFFYIIFFYFYSTLLHFTANLYLFAQNSTFFFLSIYFLFFSLLQVLFYLPAFFDRKTSASCSARRLYFTFILDVFTGAGAV